MEYKNACSVLTTSPLLATCSFGLATGREVMTWQPIELAGIVWLILYKLYSYVKNS